MAQRLTTVEKTTATVYMHSQHPQKTTARGSLSSFDREIIVERTKNKQKRLIVENNPRLRDDAPGSLSSSTLLLTRNYQPSTALLSTPHGNKAALTKATVAFDVVGSQLQLSQRVRDCLL